jgi:transcriptional regulator with XRE-family HTH domain
MTPAPLDLLADGCAPVTPAGTPAPPAPGGAGLSPGSTHVSARVGGSGPLPAGRAARGREARPAGSGRGIREHGTNARYVWGPDENGTEGHGCRCRPCKDARRVFANHRNRMQMYGRWQPYVDAGAAREHVRMLARCGIGLKRAAELAGVSTGSMSKLLYGGPGERPPSRRIRPETEAAILAVRPSLEVLGASVDATGTRRRLQALVTVGWSQAKLAARLGMLPSNFGTIMYRRERVAAATARAVAALYDELWDQAPPESGHREKIAANRARNYARARGWAPPAAWDDDRIGDPAASPAQEWRRPTRLGSAGLAEEYRELAALGYTRTLAAERLGVSRAALEKALERSRGAA